MRTATARVARKKLSLLYPKQVRGGQLLTQLNYGLGLDVSLPCAELAAMGSSTAGPAGPPPTA